MTAPDTSRAAAAAVLAMAREHGYDLPGRLAGVLAAVAAELGSTDALVASRPGSWEAAAITGLVHGTVGWADEDLAEHKLPGLATAPSEPLTLDPADLRTVLGALDDAADWRAEEAARCDDSPPCALHAADTVKADAYRALATRLGEHQ